MLSIIISSYQPHYYTALEQNIAATCGVEYELIKIDNPGVMGLCEAYNKGAEKATYENLLFLHEDVKFHSQNWGLRVLEGLQIPDAGLIGIAGSKRKFNLPYGFYNAMPGENFAFLHHSGEAHLEIKDDAIPVPVRVIDGVFIAMTKKVWSEFSFAKDLSGYHFYDLNISLRVSEQFQNYLIPNIGIEHFSKGNFGDHWIRACLNFFKTGNYRYDSVLPKEKRDLRIFWYQRLFTEKISFGNRLQYVLNMGTNKDTLKAAVEFLIHKKF
ncbi:glycosyltransferase [Chryseobacterium caseinilyticum]|uniref:Streptomycin biosynthesis protein StrF domain-containing protein n=1 Tax=Chryseobacterium caseinilyticum TaxID=2771428 RepID=A0ABR8ZG82_9FLAO|nr:glycosyltransferase [Chryseobacterium caseinilyticum]MBD8084306.1 hypothetical protein [Chryseobacterium caseinilyticum]